MEDPTIYDGTDMFKSGMFLKTTTKLAHIFNFNLNASFSHDTTNNDLHNIRLPLSSLINSVDQNGNILISYENIVQNVEKNMKEVFGTSYYDRQMYLFNVSSTIDTFFPEPLDTTVTDVSSDCELIISPLEFDFPGLVDINLNAQAIPVESGSNQRTDWDFSVIAYGNFINGKYNLDMSKVDVEINKEVIYNSAVLFDEKNPKFRFKEILNKTVNCGNVDQTTLKNIVRSVDVLKKSESGGVKKMTTLTIIPKFLMNRVSSTTTDGDYITIASGLENGIPVSYKMNIDTTSVPTNSDDNMEVILKKIVSGGIFTRFNNFPMIDLTPIGVDVTNQTAGPFFKSQVDTELAILETGVPVDLDQSKLWHHYNKLGKLEEDLNANDQYPTADDNTFVDMDLDNFKMNLYISIHGTITENTTETSNNDQNLKLLNTFFPNSNAYIDDTTSAIKYNTVVKFQLINKKIPSS